MEFDSQAIAALEKNVRTNLINSLTGFKSANLVGTIDEKGQTNLAVINSLVHIGAHPPLNAIVFRPDSVPRHTLSNILNTGVYTLNHIHRDFFKEAHQTAARYPGEVSEFQAVGLTQEYREEFPAPYVAEARIKVAMRYREHHNLSINGTVLVIGEVVAIELPDGVMGQDGFLDLECAGTVAISGLDSYHSTSRLARLSYAKPDREVREIEV